MTSFLLAFDNQSISHNKLFVETETIVTKREKLPTLALDNADGVKKKNEVSEDLPSPSGQISFSAEIIRKGIHLASLSIPIFYYYVSRNTAIAVLLPVVIFSVAIDFSRHYIPA